MITATLKKLRYRPGIRVALHDAPEGFEAEIGSAGEVVRAGRGTSPSRPGRVVQNWAHDARRPAALAA